jgi:hypothetical protein
MHSAFDDSIVRSFVRRSFVRSSLSSSSETLSLSRERRSSFVVRRSSVARASRTDGARVRIESIDP